MRFAPSNMLSSIFLLAVPRRCFFSGFFLLFVFHVLHAVFSVSCSLVGTCWEKADTLALLYVMISRVFVIFSYCVLGQWWYLIVSIPDLCLLPYLEVLPFLTFGLEAIPFHTFESEVMTFQTYVLDVHVLSFQSFALEVMSFQTCVLDVLSFQRFALEAMPF